MKKFMHFCVRAKNTRAFLPFAPTRAERKALIGYWIWVDSLGR